MSDKKKQETFYYVNPKAQPEPEAKVYCADSTCLNFIRIHQTCNLKNVFINAEGRCEFRVKRKVSSNDKNKSKSKSKSG